MAVRAIQKKLAEKMMWMIENSEKAKKMGEKKGFKICKEKFDVNNVNKVILNAMGLWNLLLLGSDKMDLYESIKNGKEKISVIGLGYVGLPLAISFAKVAFEVFGYDISKEKVKQVSKGNRCYKRSWR